MKIVQAKRSEDLPGFGKEKDLIWKCPYCDTIIEACQYSEAYETLISTNSFVMKGCNSPGCLCSGRSNHYTVHLKSAITILSQRFK